MLTLPQNFSQPQIAGGSDVFEKAYNRRIQFKSNSVFVSYKTSFADAKFMSFINFVQTCWVLPFLEVSLE